MASKPNSWFRPSLTATPLAFAEAARISDATSLVSICGGSESYRTAASAATVSLPATRVRRYAGPSSTRPYSGGGGGMRALLAGGRCSHPPPGNRLSITTAVLARTTTRGRYCCSGSGASFAIVPFDASKHCVYRARLGLPLPTRLFAHAFFASALPEDRVAKLASVS